jgi:brefeldin A-inhibited guanine nucleotide-exchange protein
MANIDPALIDKIFHSSYTLDLESILDFVKCLCDISKTELDHPTNPRFFSLSKLVDVAYVQMGREKFKWNLIWEIIKEHFNYAGCHKNQ